MSITSCSVIVPVYNSEKSLPLLIQRLDQVLPTLFEHYEVILINDGSRDKSWSVIETLAAQYSWLQGINLMRNYGQHNALLCGIRTAQYDLIVTMDDDLQHPPEEIHHLIQKLNEGYDVVYGAAQKREHGLLRNLATQVTKRALQTIMGIETARNVSAFRAFHTILRDAFAAYDAPNVMIDVLLSWGTTKFTYVPVQHEPRQIGDSNYTLRKLIQLTVNMVTGFSVLPLQFASLLGFGFTLFGMLLFVYVIGRYMLEGGSIPGFPFLASAVVIFSGVQLFALGIIGEYLARLYQRGFNKPAYVIRAKADDREN